MVNADFGINLSPVISCIGKVIHQRRILCAVVAASDAIAAANTGALGDTEWIDPILERHVDGKAIEVSVDALRRSFEFLKLVDGRKMIRVSCRLQHFHGVFVAIGEA